MENKNTSLDKGVFKEGIAKLTHVYPSWEFKYLDPKAMKVLYSFFDNLTEEQFNCMVHNHILNEYGAPTVASLNKNKKENRPLDKTVGGGIPGVKPPKKWTPEEVKKLREENE